MLRNIPTSTVTVLRLTIVVQLLSHVLLFEIPWTAARQASLSSTISWSLFKFMPIELVLLSNHLILYRTNTSNYTLSWSFFLLTSKSLRLQFINNGFTHNIGSMFKTVVPVQTLANQINVTDNLEINSVLCNKKYTN